VKAGDWNTAFFHKKAHAWKMRNHVHKIIVESNQRVNTFNAIQEAYFKHFKRLYIEDTPYMDEDI
jgi:hypothetical protein